MSAAFIPRLALLLTLFLPFAGTAEGHAVVVEADPADGAVLPVAPGRILVRFNEPVSLITAQVLDGSGRNVVGENAATSTNGAVEIDLPDSLPHGTYVASYRVVSLDGHPIGGSLIFSVGEASASTNLDTSGEVALRRIWTVVRATLDTCLLGSAGGVLFLLLAARGDFAEGSAGRIVVRFALLGLAVAVLSIGVQGGSLAGTSIGAITSADTWRIGFTSTFGRSALIAIAGFAVTAIGVRRTSRPIVFLGAAVSLASFAFAGHVVTAGSRWLTVPALLVHTSAVAFWVGSLLPLRSALLSGNAALLFRRFSRFAILAVGLLFVAGTVIAALQVRSFSALGTTRYGWILLAKLSLVCGLLALAAINKLRLTPALSRGDATAAVSLGRTISAELLLVGGILILTAALGTTPPPRALVSEHVHTPEHHPVHDHHAHGMRVEMSTNGRRAVLTLSSGHAGPNDVEIALTAEDGSVLEAKEVVFTAANVGAGVEPIRRTAASTNSGVWVAKGVTLVPAGKWSIKVEVLVSDFEKLTLEDSVELQ